MRVMRLLTPAVLAGLVLQAACTPGGTPSRQKRHDFPTYSISVPVTWTRADHKSGGPEGIGRLDGEGVRFEGLDGEYLDIALDLGMGTSSADTWLKAKLGAGGEVITLGDDKLCKQTPPDPNNTYVPECTRGDGRLDAWLFFEERGHGYVIMMGNSKRERAEDLPTVRKVVESMKLK